MNKSEELAKLLGIEPKCLDITFSGCKYANDDTRKCCYRYKNKSCEFKSYNFYIYPDFTKPSNFVKLLEIYWNIFRISSECFEDNNDKFSLEGFIYGFNEDLENIEEYSNEAIRLAQQTEWEY